MTNNLRKARIKQLRADARKLVAVAKRLRDEAKSLVMEERAEKAQANFYSKRAKVDPNVVLSPNIPDEEKELVLR